MAEDQTVREKIDQIRSLIQACETRISILRPAWNAHLAMESLRRLSQAVDELDRMTAASPESSASRARQTS